MAPGYMAGLPRTQRGYFPGGSRTVALGELEAIFAEASVTDFCMSLEHAHDGSTLRCEGELDLLTSARVEEAVDVCLERKPKSLEIDAGGVTLLTSAGIKTLLQTALRCHDAGIAFKLTASGHARRVLDMVGLWWLGVVDDGVRLQAAMSEALGSYATLRFDGRFVDTDPT